MWLSDFEDASSYLRKIGKATFDSRAFVLPHDEVVNYFIWRQQDASKNSVQMVARSLYSHKELQGVQIPVLHDMLIAKGMNWNNLPTWQKRGYCVVKRSVWEDDKYRFYWALDEDIPIFTADRDYVMYYKSKPNKLKEAEQ